jgi:bifunctional DNA-binding transcriptional regulator/antitoxin component of YhaV-PrlF toxin-antitoxin module
VVTLKGRYLDNGRLSIPEEVATSLLLKRGEEVRVMIEKEKFDREEFLGLFGVWKDKSEKEIEIFREILKERDLFERRKVKI